LNIVATGRHPTGIMCTSCVSRVASNADTDELSRSASPASPTHLSTAQRHPATGANDHWIFVYGTHKRGFACHAPLLDSATFVGTFRTLEAYPLIVTGPFFSPILLNAPNSGDRVFGEVFAIDDKTLEALDRAENIQSPLFSRNVLPVAATADPSFTANTHVYMADPELTSPASTPTISDYQCHNYVPRHRRPRPTPADTAITLDLGANLPGTAVLTVDAAAAAPSFPNSPSPKSPGHSPSCSAALATSNVSSSASLVDDVPVSRTTAGSPGSSIATKNTRAATSRDGPAIHANASTSMYAGSAWFHGA
jgi:gamma-glutamylaminecyclotransferase